MDAVLNVGDLWKKGVMAIGEPHFTEEDAVPTITRKIHDIDKIYPCFKRLEDGLAEGEGRKLGMFRLACYYAQCGLPIRRARDRAAAINQKNKPPMAGEEFEEAVRDGYNWYNKQGKEHGCKDAMLSQFCDKQACGFGGFVKRNAASVALRLGAKHTQRVTLDPRHFDDRLIAKKFVNVFGTSTDAPNEFIFTAGLMATAALLGNKVSTRIGSSVIYPNVFCAIVGDSSISRKSTCLNYATKMLTEMHLASMRKDEKPCTYPDHFSPESFIEEVGDQPSGLIKYHEMGELLKMCEKNYMAGFKEFLTAMYDSTEQWRKTLKKRTDGSGTQVDIRNPAINLFTATTKEWLVSNLTEYDMMGGFLQRFMFCLVPENQKPFKAFPDEIDKNTKAYIELLSEMRRLRDKYQPGTIIPWTDEAKIVFEEWFSQECNKYKHEVMGTYFNRYQVHVRKIATIFACNLDLEKIDVNVLGMAMTAGEFYWKSVQYMIKNELGFNKVDSMINNIINQLVKHDGVVSLSNIKKHTRGKAEEIMECLNYMREEELIVTKPHKDPKKNRASIHVFLLKGVGE